ncbi:MAG: tRNA (adenosine(37)-N6)-dimethylallyltransferase MiaA [Ferruginibacter sp.]
MKTCIIIAGPTAIGKTALAINVAQHFSTDIISADSRQCYKELNIAVAKPSAEELAAVRHYFINSHHIQENLSAADFEKYALDAADNIFQKNDVAVMTGGTGLYIKAFMYGLDDIPFIDGKMKEGIIKKYKKSGMEWLQQEIEKQDPDFFATGEIKNPHRIIRALEVKAVTGKSITKYQSKQKKERPFNIILIGLQMPRTEIYERINNRVDAMVANGVIEEAKELLPYKNLNALQTVGYRELFDYFEDKIPLDEAISLIKQNTRHYAKRQETWFKKEEGMHFCTPSLNGILSIVKNSDIKI